MTTAFDTANTVLRRALVLGAIATAAIAVVASVVGVLVAGTPGLISGALGAALALVFLGVTALSLILAGRFNGLGTNAFFAAMLAGWFVKFIVFFVAMQALRGQPWVQPGVLFGSVVATVLASLVIDAVVVSKARIPVGTR